MGTMNFGQALEVLKTNGGRVTRMNWNGPGQYLELRKPIEGATSITLPYISIRTIQGDAVPWVASQTDLLSEDWAKE